MDLHSQHQRHRMQQRGAEVGRAAQPPGGGQMDGAAEEEIVGVPEEGPEVELPGAQPVEDDERQPLPRRDDAGQRAIEHQEGRQVTERHRRRGGAVIPPQQERQPDQQGGDPSRRLAAGRQRVAEPHHLPARRQQPAARQQVELIAADLAARHHQRGEHEAGGEGDPDPPLGRASRQPGPELPLGHPSAGGQARTGSAAGPFSESARARQNGIISAKSARRLTSASPQLFSKRPARLKASNARTLPR